MPKQRDLTELKLPTGPGPAPTREELGLLDRGGMWCRPDAPMWWEDPTAGSESESPSDGASGSRPFCRPT